MPINVSSATETVYTTAEVDELLAGLPTDGGMNVEAVQDAVAAMLAQGAGVALSYDDAANSLTITGTIQGGPDTEAVRDAIGVALVGLPPITVTVNDAADTIVISCTAYSKPGTGVPKADLESTVQTSLGKADTALQSIPIDTARVLVWTGTAWPDRPADTRPTIFVGGTAAPADADVKNGDLWVS